MALHLEETDDHPRIAWVCARHELLFYAGDAAVVNWVHDAPAQPSLDASPAC
jgi:hypothetical protein